MTFSTLFIANVIKAEYETGFIFPCNPAPRLIESSEYGDYLWFDFSTMTEDEIEHLQAISDYCDSLCL